MARDEAGRKSQAKRVGTDGWYGSVWVEIEALLAVANREIYTGAFFMINQ